MTTDQPPVGEHPGWQVMRDAYARSRTVEQGTCDSCRKPVSRDRRG